MRYIAQKTRILRCVLSAAFLYLADQTFVSAHEAYVEDRVYFWNALHSSNNVDLLSALKDPHNLFIAVSVAAGVLAFLVINFFFLQSLAARRIHQQLERLAFLGPLFVRVTIAVSFFYSALTGSFLGPELRLEQLPGSSVIQITLFTVSILILLGLFTEIAALASLVVFLIGCQVFGNYMANYANYLGEIIVLLLVGTRHWSLDQLILGKLKGFQERFLSYETAVVRIFYGVSLVYAAIAVKFLHPEITIKVVKDWNLTQFHWLFPSDPALVTLGAGLVEAAIGLFIIVGFQLRAVVLISLFYITLSLIYFKEAVWPHILLYGISLDLLVQPAVFSMDRWLFEKKKL